VSIARIEPVRDGDTEEAAPLRRPSLGEVLGWLDAADPFSQVLEDRRNSGSGIRRDPFE